MYCVIAVRIEEVKGYMDNKISENNSAQIIWLYFQKETAMILSIFPVASVEISPIELKKRSKSCKGNLTTVHLEG